MCTLLVYTYIPLVIASILILVLNYYSIIMCLLTPCCAYSVLRMKCMHFSAPSLDLCSSLGAL